MSTITTTEPTAPLTGCQPWCKDHADRHLQPTVEGESSWGHSWRIAEGADSEHYGPIYSATIEAHLSGEVRLYVTVETTTLTADQAEVLGRALLEGAAALRSSGDAVATDNLCPSYQAPAGGWVHVGATVFEPTPAERDLVKTTR